MNPSRASHGSVVLKLLFFGVIASGVIGSLYWVLNQVRMDAECRENMGTIYQALEQYELEKGALPALAYYPDEPYVDADSIRLVLESFGLPPEACICPAGHTKLQKQGLSYIWNAAMNGANLTGKPEDRQWLLVDAQALAPEIPPPHFGGYHVLYSDGEIVTLRDPLTTLPGL